MRVITGETTMGGRQDKRSENVPNETGNTRDTLAQETEELTKLSAYKK